MGIVYLNFSKAFNTVSRNIFIEKGIECRLGEWTVRWGQNWLNNWVQRVVISIIKCSWRAVTCGAPKANTV